MPLALTHNCIARHRSEACKHSRFGRTIIGAVALMMAAIIAGLPPLSAKAQTSPQPLTPQTGPAYPYQQPPAAQGVYPYSYTIPITTHSGPTTIHGAGVIRGGGDGLSEFSSGLADASTAASAAPSSIRGSGASALVTAPSGLVLTSAMNRDTAVSRPGNTGHRGASS